MPEAPTAAPPSSVAKSSAGPTASPTAAVSKTGQAAAGTTNNGGPSPGQSPLSPYDELDSLQREAEEKVTKAKAPPEKPKKPEAGAEKPETTPEKPKGEKEEPETKPEEKPPQRASELRTAYEGMKKKVSEMETELRTLRQAKPADDPEKKSMTERIGELEKALEERETKLRLAHYESSQEYTDKYETPIKRAFEQAYSDITQLKIEDGEGNERAATPADFNALVQMTLPQAIQASKVFGDAAQEVLGHRRRIIQMNQDRTQAISDAHNRQLAGVKEQQAAMAQQRQWWGEENKEAETKYEKWSKPDDSDPREAGILDRATQVADMAFGDTSQLPARERVKLHAAIRNKARWFDLQVYRNQKLREENESLKAKLAEFEESTPDKDVEKRGASPKAVDNWEAELEGLDRR